MSGVLVAGKSLLWVGILGLVVFYLYGLISFALLRSSFDKDDMMYCGTLWQCTVTVVRYGLVGDIFDVSSVLRRGLVAWILYPCSTLIPFGI